MMNRLLGSQHALGSVIRAAGLAALGAMLASSCASILGREKTKPIQNPFGDVYPGAAADPNQALILRTKKGDRAVEVQMPGSAAQMSDFVIPVSPAFQDTKRSPASVGGDGMDPIPDAQAGSAYKDHNPTASDRDIVQSFPQGLPEDERKRTEIESGLGLVPGEDQSLPKTGKSYLATVDQVKQLYRNGRYEAALLEVDEAIRVYQTDPRLHQMRGTLLDRMGRTELAIKAWQQALRFDQGNQTLRRFVDRREQKRSMAGK